MAQHGPKTAPRWPKTAPRWPQMAPSSPQGGTKMVHDMSRWPQVPQAVCVSTPRLGTAREYAHASFIENESVNKNALLLLYSSFLPSSLPSFLHIPSFLPCLSPSHHPSLPYPYDRAPGDNDQNPYVGLLTIMIRIPVNLQGL